MQGIKKAAAAALLVLGILFAAVLTAGAAEPEKIQYLPDGRGGFYGLYCSSDGYDLRLTEASGESRRLLKGSTVIRYFTVSGGLVVLVAERMNSQPVIVSKAGSDPQVIFLSDMELSEGLVAADTHYNVYAVDHRNRSTVRKYSDTGEILEDISCGFQVQALFFQGDELYAAGDGKCMSLLQRSPVSTVLPRGQFVMCGSYTCGADGSVYSFSGGSFSLVCKSEAPVSCTASGKIYTARGSTLCRVDTEGNVISSFDTGVSITALYSSADSVAYESAGGLVTADLSRLKSPAAAQESTPPTESIAPDSGNEAPAARDTSDEGFSLSSSKYDLRGEEIIIDSGTTVAAFMGDIRLSGGSAEFYDASGGEISSGQLGSGCSVDFTGGGQVRSFVFIVKGDLTGEGNINSRDETTLCSALLGDRAAENMILPAADLNGSRKIDPGDLVLLRKMLGKASGTDSDTGKTGVSLSTDAGTAGKAFYVYADFSAEPASAVLAKITYDSTRFRLTSAKLTDGSGADRFRYSDREGEVRLLLTGGANGKRAALRFECPDDTSYSGSITAALCAADGNGGEFSCESTAPLMIEMSAAPEKSSAAGKSEVSQKSQTSRKSVKESSVSPKNSASSPPGEETREESDGDVIEYTIPDFNEPTDESKRKLLIAGVILLAAAVGVVGYQLAMLRKENKR